MAPPHSLVFPHSMPESSVCLGGSAALKEATFSASTPGDLRPSTKERSSVEQAVLFTEVEKLPG
jgi:hypothetical protein